MNVGCSVDNKNGDSKTTTATLSTLANYSAATISTTTTAIHQEIENFKASLLLFNVSKIHF
jgi:hypothetical protein